MQPNSASRRTFLKQSAVGASALALASPGSARGYAANEKVNLGWIGCGSRASQLMPHVLAITEARTAAVCDLIPDRIERFQKLAERDKPAGYTDFREMLDKEKLDGILVITQPNAHAECVVPVLEAGFHCFAEKPMDITVEAIDAIVKAARKARKDSGAFYQIGTQRRYNPGYVAGMKEIEAGLIGKVHIIQGQWHWPWDVSRNLVERDGGRFIEQASHHTDVAAWAAGDVAPLACCSMGGTMNPSPEGPNVHSETYSATNFYFPSGAIFSYTHFFHLPRAYQAEKMWVFGPEGGVDLVHATFNRYEPRSELAEKQRAAEQGKETDYPEVRRRIGEDSGPDWNKGTPEELHDFVNNVKTGGKRLPAANVETGRVCSLMCIMARKSMVNEARNAFEPRMIRWEDLGSTTT